MAHYDAFLLRIWRTGEGDAGCWAIRLEHLPDGQGARLDSLADLTIYLRAVLDVASAGGHAGVHGDPALTPDESSTE